MNFFRFLKPREDEVEKFLGGFHRLSQRQIERIIGIINEEVKRSAKTRLRISEDHILKKKVVVLTILDEAGGIWSIKKVGFDEARRRFSETLYSAMEEEARYYFEENKNTRKTDSNLTYNCHLDALTGSILSAIFNDELDF